METIGQLFGRRVQELRKTKKLTQEQLGQKAGIDYKYLGEIERGVKTCSFGIVEKLAQSLDANVYELFVPTARIAAVVEKEIEELLANPRRIDLSKIDEFLRGIRSAVRKLDRPEPGRK